MGHGARSGQPSMSTVGVSWDHMVEAAYREHYLHLVRLAVQLVDDQDTAEDTVQEVFAALYRGGPSAGRIVDPKNYLRIAVVNRCRSVLRRRRTVRASLPAAEDRVEAADVSLLRRDSRARMTCALSRLPTRQREVLVLRYYEQLSIPEIAGVLRISPRAVSSSLNRGLKSLNRLIGSAPNERS
jgi:RNA polymerase sigma factor (sigma-70 family)